MGDECVKTLSIARSGAESRFRVLDDPSRRFLPGRLDVIHDCVERSLPRRDELVISQIVQQLRRGVILLCILS